MLDTSKSIAIAVHSRTEHVREQWLDLQKGGLSSVYQSYDWCQAWLDVFARDLNVEPCVVTGRDVSGRLRFVLPLSRSRSGGQWIIEWLGAEFATYGLGVYDRDFASTTTSGEVGLIWRDILAALDGSADIIWLRNMPAVWHGIKHPLAPLFTVRSANQTHQFRLQPDYDSLYVAKRSASSRRGSRKRDKKLFASGTVGFCGNGNAAATDALIAATLRQQAQLLAYRGVHNIFPDQTVQFLSRIAAFDASRQVQLLPVFLMHDETLIAAKLGVVYDNIYWAMVSSLTADETYRRVSPGDLALRELIRRCCDQGVELFDFATGDAEYKDHWSDSSTTLHDSLQARSASGVAWVTAKRAAIDVKRLIKNSPFLWPKLQSLRRTVLGAPL